MNVLVTGGAGYIGSELLERGHNVIVIDNLVNSSHKAVERVEQITGKPVAFYENDVRDRAALDRIFEKHDIDCAIHFAGLKAVGESVAMPLEYYDNNLFSTVRLCEAMRDHGVKNIVFSSSATVYSGDNEMPLREDSNTGHCTNPYGWTKYMSEQILRDTAHAVDDFSVSLLRYFNPIGAHSSGLIGEDPRGIPNNLMPFIAQVAVGRRDHLNVFGRSRTEGSPERLRQRLQHPRRHRRARLYPRGRPCARSRCGHRVYADPPRRERVQPRHRSGIQRARYGQGLRARDRREDPL